MVEHKYNPNNELVTYINPFTNRETTVELWLKPLGQFTVRAGASSDYSYTGFIPNMETFEQFKNEIDLLHCRIRKRAN